MAGRTVSRWVNFVIEDSAQTIRDIPINSISMVGVVYEEQDLTAFQDLVKGALPNMPDAPIEITGPWSTAAAQAASGSAVAPALSGSHTVLNDLPGAMLPLTLDVQFGDRATYTDGAAQFGISQSATSGYICTSYTVNADDSTYSARFVLFPGSALPAWGVAVEA